MSMDETPYQPPAEGAQAPPPIAPPEESFSALDVLVPTNPLAAFSCYTGIFGCVLCGTGIVLGPIAILLGVLGLKKWNVQESSYGKGASKARAYIGIITGVLGILISVLFIAASLSA